MRRYLASLNPQLSRQLWTLLSTVSWLSVFAGCWWFTGAATTAVLALALIPHGLWLIAAGAALAAGLSALLLERVLPEALRRTPRLAAESA